MIKFEDIKIGQRVYWIDSAKVKAGEIDEITIRKDGLSCRINNGYNRPEVESSSIYLTREEAEAYVVDIEIKELKKEIYSKCENLKFLKARKATLITAYLAGIKNV